MARKSEHVTWRAELAAGFEPLLLELGAALREAARLVITNASGPRSWGRRLEIDKDLAWRAYRMAHATDFAGVTRALPGSRGLEMIERALAKAGCGRDLERRIAGLRQEIARRLEHHGIDRRALAALVAGGGDSPAERDARRRARADARLAAARMWGIEARTSLRVFMLAPGRDGAVDAVYFNLLEGVRRLRPGAPWRIITPTLRFRPEAAAPGSSELDGALRDARRAGGPLVPGGAHEPVIDELSDRAALAEIARSDADGGDLFFHGDGLNPTKRLRIAWGEYLPGVGTATAATPGGVAALRTAVQLPVARTVLRTYFHRDLRRGSDPSSSFTIALDAVGRPAAFERPMRLVPDAEVERVAGTKAPPGLGDAARTFERLVALGAAALGSTPGDFTETFELSVANPPMLSNLGMQWLLAEG